MLMCRPTFGFRGTAQQNVTWQFVLRGPRTIYVVPFRSLFVLTKSVLCYTD